MKMLASVKRRKDYEKQRDAQSGPKSPRRRINQKRRIRRKGGPDSKAVRLVYANKYGKLNGLNIRPI